MGEEGWVNMYKVKETKTFENCIYSYDEFNAIREAQDLCGDLAFNDNEIEALSGEEFNSQILRGVIPLDNMCSKDPLNPNMFYIFRRTLSGKFVPLHVTMRPSTAANLLRGSSRYGSISIDRE